jgi:hypothetical protein
MLQLWIVGVLVALAGLYSLWYVLPASVRHWLGRGNRWLAGAPAVDSCSRCGKCSAISQVSSSPLDSQGQPLVFHRKP